MFQRVVYFTNKYKIVRGMISYAILWPLGSLIEQRLVEKRTFETYDWMKCLRFSIYGAVIMGPAMYAWIRLAATIWPRSDFRSSVSKAVTEQFTVDPSSIAAFLFLMSLFEGRTVKEAQNELRSKFFDTYKIGAIYWPTMQTLNFTFVPLKNQVVCTSFFSMLWSAFLAYMEHLEITQLKSTKSDAESKPANE